MHTYTETCMMNQIRGLGRKCDDTFNQKTAKRKYADETYVSFNHQFYKQKLLRIRNRNGKEQLPLRFFAASVRFSFGTDVRISGIQITNFIRVS